MGLSKKAKKEEVKTALGEKRQKNWRSVGRQFTHIVSNREDAPLSIHLFQSPEHEPAHAHVMFDIAEHGFNIRSTLLAQGNTLLGEQIGFGLLTICSQFETNLDAPVAFSRKDSGTVCLGTLWLERTGGTFGTLIETPFGELAVLSAIGAG